MNIKLQNNIGNKIFNFFDIIYWKLVGSISTFLFSVIGTAKSITIGKKTKFYGFPKLVLFSSSGVLLLIPTKKELKLPAFYRVISSIIIVFIIIGLYQLTFHFLLSFLLSLLIILFYTK